jgi:DNA-binding MarR family transcriptional regulator
VAAHLPLPTLLSHVLVGFTIEFDNEFERRTPHVTTMLGSASGSGPWLTSMVMWSNFMQYVPEDGLTVGELQRLSRTPKLALSGMERWGYVFVEPKRARADWLVRPTRKGRMAQEIWRPLFGAIEYRWAERFGKDEIDKLRASLLALIHQFDIELPDYLPVLGYGLCTQILERKRQAPEAVQTLPACLSKVLLAFALDFERDSDLSLALCANVVRLLDDTGVRVRDFPRLSGVSKEAIKMAHGFLEKRGLMVVEPDRSAAKTKSVRLTAKGLKAQDAYNKLLANVERHWQARFGKAAIDTLRESLEPLVGERLLLGLKPYPDGWRAAVPQAETLPHYPMVLHRGGYPDGS